MTFVTSLLQIIDRYMKQLFTIDGLKFIEKYRENKCLSYNVIIFATKTQQGRQSREISYLNLDEHTIQIIFPPVPTLWILNERTSLLE